MPNPCPYCGDHMTNVRRKQCGKSDCKRAFNAERMRKWNREYHEKHGQWYARHHYGEAQREYMRGRYEQQAHWRERYPERAAAADARRRMRIEQARTAEVFAPLDVHVRDGWTCRCAGSPSTRGRVARPDERVGGPHRSALARWRAQHDQRPERSPGMQQQEG